MLKCDICNRKKQFHYKTVFINNKTVTFCDECRYGRKISHNLKSKEALYDSLQIPFWKIMGQKPKERDIRLEKFLKYKGMTYGDYRRFRDQKAKYPSAFNKFNEHLEKYGRTGQPPLPNFKKAG